MNMQQDTAPEPYQYDPTEVKPKTKSVHIRKDDNNDFGTGRTSNCGKCKLEAKRLNLNKFCKRDYAIMGKIVSKSNQNGKRDQVSFNIVLNTIYKNSEGRNLISLNQKKTPIQLIVPGSNLECRCPNLKVNKSYLILGMHSKYNQNELEIGPKTIIIEWKDEWQRRLRRYQQMVPACY
jgi:netrin receptor unc-5